MATAIIAFEDSEEVVRRFGEQHLAPALEEVPLTKPPRLKFVPYWEDPELKKPRPEGHVADEAAQWLLANGEFEKIAFVVDLHPDQSSTPNIKYGLEVIRLLSQRLHGLGGSSLGDFLEAPGHLIALLSIYLDMLEGVLPQAWPTSGTIQKIVNDKTAAGVTSAVKALRRHNPRVVVANRAWDMTWLSRVIAHWLSCGPNSGPATP